MPLAVIHSRDPDGRPVVKVPMSNRPGLHATVDLRDYEALVTRFGAVSWFVNDDGKGHLYVRLKGRARGNNEMVARLIMGEPPRRLIRYRDHDRLNLRSRNLDVVVPPAERRRPVPQHLRATRHTNQPQEGHSHL